VNVRPTTAALIAVVGAVTVTTGCGDDDRAGDGGLPAVVLPALAGSDTLDVRTLEGPAVVNLWATWCGPCRTELPAFQAASEQRDGVRFIGVDIGEDPADAQAFLDELGVTFEQYADVDGELSDALGVAALPVTIVVDDDGDIVERHVGPMNADELDGALADL
jgi:thiol-disulfide isomerase/thioredoxin